MSISGVYRHYKGKYYRVCFRAEDKDTGEAFVLYRQMYEPYGYWIRPWDMFFGLRTENGSAEPRFVKIAEDLEETVPENAEIVHSETLARYSLAGREGDTVLVRNTGTPSSVRR